MIAPGQRVGHYLIETRLGAGGMGEVFRAFDESLERPVAIKVLPKAVEGHPEARARMLREARAASALVHANIVTVHEVDEHDGQTILVMELVEGETLSHLLQRSGQRPVAEVLGIVRQVCTALAFAHQAGFVHRDIKSSNLMVMRDGRVKVLDFGLSKRMRAGELEPSPDTRALRKPASPPEVATDPTVPAAPERGGTEARTVPGKSGADLGLPPSMPSHDSDARARAAAAARRDDLTVEGAAMGTPGYSALELMDGQPADGRADVFSLGVVIYELLTASRPYTGVDWPNVRAQIVAEEYPRARELVPAIPAELDAAIVHALRAERDDRTPSIDALLAELAELETTGPRRRRRKTVAIALGAAVFAGGTTFAAVKVRSGGGEASKATDAAPIVALSPADAAEPVDAPPPPPPSAVQLTRTNGCAYAPAFLDDGTIAFDLTTATGARDIALLPPSKGGRPGMPKPLVRAGSLDVRPARGLTPGELVYVTYDQANPARSSIIARSLATGAEQEIIAGPHTAIAAQGGAYYYVPSDSASLRRMRDKVDQAVLSLSSDVGAPVALVATRDVSKLLISGRIDDAGTLCLIDLATSTLDCPPLQEPIGARPDTGSSGTTYYASRGGIRARSASGDDRMVAAGALASGGLAVSPSGDALVWSDCGPRQALRDATVKPAADLSVAEHIVTPVAGPGGRIAWVQRGAELVVRLPDGTTVALTAADGPTIAGAPSFDHEGGRLVFARGGDAPGLWTVDAGDPSSLHQVTAEPGDETPLFLADGSLVFTRVVDGRPSVFRVHDGGEPAPALTEHRRTVDVDRGSGRVLLRSEDGRYLFWWDPVTRHESPGPRTFAPGSDVTRGISLSPDGAWILYRSGPEGRELWRTPERIWDPQPVKLPPDTLVEAAAIDDDGHALIVTPAMRGELWRLEARRDAPF
jgi:serine/threonine protein kinase